MSDMPTIFVLVANVLRDLPAIGKNSRNEQQGFSFRGIDDVLNHLNPILAEHGVFIVPSVIDRIAEARQTRNGGTMWAVHLHVRYRLYGPAGDFVEGDAWGEGTDSGDKATSKAMTMAFKYFLFETFAISTEEQRDSDNDRHTVEETSRMPPCITPKTAAAFRESADARRLDVDALVIEATHGRTSILTEVREGDERTALKANIAEHPVLDAAPTLPVGGPGLNDEPFGP